MLVRPENDLCVTIRPFIKLGVGFRSCFQRQVVADYKVGAGFAGEDKIAQKDIIFLDGTLP